MDETVAHERLTQDLLILDCVTHALSGTAMVSQLNLAPDGSVIESTEDGLPRPAMMVTHRGTAEMRLNALRVALAQGAASVGSARGYQIRTGYVWPATWRFGMRGDEPGVELPVDLLVLNFVPGGKATRSKAVFKKLGLDKLVIR